MQKALFKDIRREIQNYLNSAQEEVLVAMAWFTSSELFYSLNECLSRKIRVELLLLDDAINWNPYAPDFNLFIKNGGILKIAGRGYGFMHHKFCVIDGEKLITGSYNWTYYAETRNKENIVITDDPNLVASFKQEFKYLFNKISVSASSPRLNWHDIESMQDVYFNELNYEVDCIAKNQKLPQVAVIKVEPKVHIVQKARTAVAAYNIGIQGSRSNDDFTMSNFIKKGDKLPILMRSAIAYSWVEHRNDLSACIRYGLSSDSHYNTSLVDVGIFDITCGRKDDRLQLQFMTSLTVDGHIKIIVKCIETGISKTILDTVLSYLVDYED